MLFSFGDHELDAARFELRRAGRVVPLQPKAFELLLYLVRNRDRVVPKQELLDTVWTDVQVTDASLARAVSLARRAIGDSESSAIVNIARRGYRFRAPVLVLSASANPSESRAARYVGRTQLIARATAALESALAGQGRVLFLAGEAGIGKTLTAELLADHARSMRAEVATAWGLSAGAPPLWTWTRLLRTLIAANPRCLASLPNGTRSELARLVPETATGRIAAPHRDTETARFRLFEAVQAFLSRVAHASPLALFLDDMHVAGAEALWLVEFVAQELAKLPIAIVVTCREEEASRFPQQARALERILRSTHVERWRIDRLEEADVHAFVSSRIGSEPDPALIEALVRQTGGNPLLLGESLRSLEARGLVGGARDRNAWDALLPRSIEHLMLPKLRRLSAAAVDALLYASAIGLEVERNLLERCIADPATLDDAIAELWDVGLLELGSDTRRLRFSHLLVREAVYGELVPMGAERRKCHARVMSALDVSPPVDAADLSEFARHACEAVPLVPMQRAAELTRAVADEAARLHDFERAGEWYRRAIGVLGLDANSDASLLAELQLQLGGVYAEIADVEQSRVAFHRAAELARFVDRDDLFVAAALGFAQRPSSTGQGEREVIQLLEEAEHCSSQLEPTHRIRICSRLAAELRYTDGSRAESLVEHALAEARTLGDAEALAHVLDDCSFVRRGADDPRGWIQLNTELARTASAAQDHDLELAGHKGCLTQLLELGELAEAKREIRICARIATASGTPKARWWTTVFAATRCLIEGDFDEAEQRIIESLKVAERIDTPEIALEMQAQFVYLRTEQARSGEIEAAVREQVRRFPDQPAWRAALARILVADGQLDAARIELASLSAHGFRDVPLDRAWLGTHALAAEAVAAVGDTHAAELLEQALSDHADRSVVLGSALYYGPVAHYLALLAATLERWEIAEERFAASCDAALRGGAAVFKARTQSEWAAALLMRGAPGDRARAASLAAEARTVAERCGLVAIATRARASEVALWTERLPRGSRKNRL